MVKFNLITFCVLCAVATASSAAGLTQAQIAKSSSAVILPSERAHVIGIHGKAADINRNALVWLVSYGKTAMDAVDELERAQLPAEKVVEVKEAVPVEVSVAERPPEVTLIDAPPNVLITDKAVETPIVEKSTVVAPVQGPAQGKVLFASGAWTVSKITTLTELLEVANGNLDATIEIIGHADSVGAQKENIKLGLARAAYVYGWLKSHGVEPARMHVLTKGESAPDESNVTRSGRAKNRRVVVIVNIANLSTKIVEESVDNDSTNKPEPLSAVEIVGAVQKTGNP